MTGENRDLFQALLMLLELLMAVFLEKHTPKTSSHSSKPASQTPKDDTAFDRTGTHGKGKALDPARLANTRTVETVQVIEVTVCEHCAEDLRKVRCRSHERRTRIDIVFEKVGQVSSYGMVLISTPDSPRGAPPTTSRLRPIAQQIRGSC